MAEASENAVLYSAVYENVTAAMLDMGAFEQLNKQAIIGQCDAAVIAKEHGKPHVVERIDHPAIRVIPESLGSGPLSHRELHDTAQALGEGEAALIVVGEPTLEKGFEKAVTRAATTAKRDMNAATDELAKQLIEESKA